MTQKEIDGDSKDLTYFDLPEIKAQIEAQQAWVETEEGKHHWQLVCEKTDLERKINELKMLAANSPLELASKNQQLTVLNERLTFTISELEGNIKKSQHHKPLLQQKFQENEILRVLDKLGIDAKALPKQKPGTSGAKAAARKEVKLSTRKFDKAWERLRSNGDIQDA